MYGSEEESQDTVPKYFTIKSKSNGRYLRYINDDKIMHGFLKFTGTHVVNPFAKFEVEKAKEKSNKGLVHIRCVQFSFSTFTNYLFIYYFEGVVTTTNIGFVGRVNPSTSLQRRTNLMKTDQNSHRRCSSPSKTTIERPFVSNTCNSVNIFNYDNT